MNIEPGSDVGEPTDSDHLSRLVNDIDLTPFLGRASTTADTQIGDPIDIDTNDPPLQVLRKLLLTPQFTEHFARALRASDPDLREILPRDATPIVNEFVRAFSHALKATKKAAGDNTKTQAVVDFARHLGVDHAKLDLTPHVYQRFGDILIDTMRRLAGPSWNNQLETTLLTFYQVITTAMREGSSAAPARVGATVVDVQRPSRDIVVVRLLTDVMLDYHPGQHVSVLTPYAQGVWRRLSPANPANPARQIEFHIRDIPGGALSTALVRGASIGDRWVLARPLGMLEIDRSEPIRDVLMIAGSTGIAPLRCLLMDMMRHGNNPRVHLFYGARYPGELYDLPTLVELAATAPWLTLQPVSEQDSNPWWAEDTQPLPRTLHRIQIGKLVDVVTGWGAWADRQVLVSGSPAMLQATVEGMIAVGTPRESIHFDRL